MCKEWEKQKGKRGEGQKKDAGGEDYYSASMRTRTTAIIYHFNANYNCLKECWHLCVCVCLRVCVCACVWCGVWVIWCFHSSFMSLYYISACVCTSAFACPFVNLRVCSRLILCVHVCTYLWGFKEMFSLPLSLICPAEYKELLKGYYTAPNQGPLRGFHSI